MREITPDDPSGYSGGKTTSFSYDPLGRETEMVVREGSEPARTTTTDCWPSGDKERRTKPNGVAESYFFESEGHLARKLRKKRDDTELEDQRYSYDRNGNRTQDERGEHAYNSRDPHVFWRRAKGKDAGSTVT